MLIIMSDCLEVKSQKINEQCKFIYVTKFHCTFLNKMVISVQMFYYEQKNYRNIS